MSDSAFLTQIEQSINSLLSEKKFKEAYELCNEYIRQYPDEGPLKKLRSHIEDEVESENQAIINKKLSELEPLWKEEKYESILRGLREIRVIRPNDRKINKLYTQAQRAYLEQVEKLKKTFYDKQEVRLTEVLTNNPEELLDELLDLENENQGNVDIQKLSQEFKDKLINKKVKEKSELLQSGKFEAIEHFIDQLRKIDPKSPKIEEVINYTKQNQHLSQRSEKEEFIYKGEKHLDTLMKLNKFDKAILVAKEILSLNPHDNFAKKILEKAKSKYFDQSRETVIDQIISGLPQLKEEYKSQSGQFIKL